MTRGTLDVQHVVKTCRARAAEHRTAAKRYRDSRNRDLELEYEGMALAADRLADEFEATNVASEKLRFEEIEARSREINPAPFQSFEAMLQRLRSQGIDEGQAVRSAQLTYGPEMEAVREAAKAALEQEIADADGDEEAYDRGFNDAITWHETRAREAEMLESQEQSSDRKAKLKQRAERHRLYARHLKAHLEEQKAERERQACLNRKLESNQQSLPLEVQMAFLKRTDNVAGEAFD